MKVIEEEKARQVRIAKWTSLTLSTDAVRHEKYRLLLEESRKCEADAREELNVLIASNF